MTTITLKRHYKLVIIFALLLAAFIAFGSIKITAYEFNNTANTEVYSGFNYE